MIGRFDDVRYIGTDRIYVAEHGQGALVQNVHYAHAFWPRHWAWYVLLGLVVGLAIGHATGTVVQLYIPEGEVAVGLRKVLSDV